MILPHPESDFDTSILTVGTEIIQKLMQRNDFIFVEDLLKQFMKKKKKRTPGLFFDTVTFLYCIGLIQQKGYRIKIRHTEMKQSN